VTDATPLLPGLEPRFVERRGVRLRVWEGGEGPPLLLVHGLGGAAWNYSELVPRLPGRRLIVPDLPGHCASSPLPGSAGLAGYADVVAACLSGPADVLGHSLGGAVALRLAERHPALVRRLVLAAPAGITSSTRLSQVVIALAGTIQPGRRIGRHAHLVGCGSFRLESDLHRHFEHGDKVETALREWVADHHPPAIEHDRPLSGEPDSKFSYKGTVRGFWFAKDLVPFFPTEQSVNDALREWLAEHPARRKRAQRAKS